MIMESSNSTFESHFQNELNLLIHGDNHNPHAFLGLHTYFEDKKVIRLWRPGANEIFIEVFGEKKLTRKIHEAGVFEYVVPKETNFKDYKVYHQNGLLAHDVYAFLPTIGELDLYLFGKGVHYELYHVLGAKITTHEGIQGTKFAVWAPSARRVSLIGDFNFWDGRVNPMRSMGQSGIWELFVPGMGEGEKYKFEVKTQGGDLRIKSDP